MCDASIHLDIYDIDIEIIEEFLFLLLITKSYRINENIFYLLADTEIYLEVSNNIDFYSKFPILSLIPSKNINKLVKNKLEPLITSLRIDSNVKIVSNYLKLIKENKINENIIFFKGFIPIMEKSEFVMTKY